MAGYTKLFNSILASTIWREDDATRIVWITMLALADKYGIVDASVPGLADLAHVPLEACERALTTLHAPDPYSRSTMSNGRRIVRTDGGWRLVNHGKYRAKMNSDERRAYLAVKQRESRSRRQLLVNTSQQTSTPVNRRRGSSTTSTHPSPSPSPSPDQKEEKREPADEYHSLSQQFADTIQADESARRRRKPFR